MNKTIIVLEGADQDEIKHFIEALKKDDVEFIGTSNKLQLFELKDGALFEVVTSLEKVVT